jgi:hypothetical protein
VRAEKNALEIELTKQMELLKQTVTDSLQRTKQLETERKALPSRSSGRAALAASLEQELEFCRKKKLQIASLAKQIDNLKGGLLPGLRCIAIIETCTVINLMCTDVPESSTALRDIEIPALPAASATDELDTSTMSIPELNAHESLGDPILAMENQETLPLTSSQMDSEVARLATEYSPTE